MDFRDPLLGDLRDWLDMNRSNLRVIFVELSPFCRLTVQSGRIRSHELPS